MSPASKLVIEAAGGAWRASLNHYSARDNRMVTTQQVDDCVYVVGQDNFNVARFELTDWIDGHAQTSLSSIECDDAIMAWELLQLLREDCFLWQCGGCDAWIFTSNRPRVGRLRCSTCSEGGVDFRHADRHVGGQSEP